MSANGQLGQGWASLQKHAQPALSVQLSAPAPLPPAPALAPGQSVQCGAAGGKE